MTREEAIAQAAAVTVCGIPLTPTVIPSGSFGDSFIFTGEYRASIGPIRICFGHQQSTTDYFARVIVYEQHESNYERGLTLQQCIAWAQKKLPEMVQQADAAMDEVRRWIR